MNAVLAVCAKNVPVWGKRGEMGGVLYCWRKITLTSLLWSQVCLDINFKPTLLESKITSHFSSDL